MNRKVLVLWIFALTSALFVGFLAKTQHVWATGQPYTITGTVRDFDGTPLTNIRVRTDSQDPVFASTRTDKNGVYTLTVTAGTYHLLVREHFNELDPPEQVVTVPPDRSDIDFTFPERFIIRGVVKEHDGTPVADTWVRTDFGDPLSLSVRTNNTGLYSMTVIAGTYHLRVREYRNELDPPEQMVTVPPDQSNIDFIFPERFVILGVVKEYDGTPVADTWVRTDSDDPLRVSTLTDAAGAYTLTALAGIYQLQVNKFHNALDPLPQVVTLPPNQTRLDFTFPQRFIIQGTVTTHDGLPVIDARVSTDFDDPVRVHTSTGATGEYTLTVVAGLYHISIRKEGLPEPLAQMVTVQADMHGVDLKFLQPYKVSGVVRDDKDNPLQGVSINGGLADTITAADGTYMTLIAPGETRLSASKDGYEPSESLLVPAPPHPVGVDFVLRIKDRTLRGQVKNTSGQPLAETRVWADNLLDLGDDSMRTDALGMYTLTVPAGVYWVEAEHDDYVPMPPQEVDLRNQDAQFNLVLEAASHTIRGFVYDSTGASVASALVEASVCELDFGAYTDALGAYTLTVPADTYEISAWKSGYAHSDDLFVSVPPNAADINLILPDLPPAYHIRGRVTDNQGQPLEDVRVHADDGPGGDVDWTDATGFYSLTVTAGTYNISAEKKFYASPPVKSVSVPPDSQNVDFVMDALPWNQHIQGKMMDENGKPIPTAYISVDEVNRPEIDEFKRAYYNGTYSVTLPAGTYEIHGWSRLYASSDDQTITLPPNRTDVDFTLKRREQLITGRVVDANGNPICNADIRAQGYISDSEDTERNGRYALRVGAGNYTIHVTAEGYAPFTSQTVTVPPFSLSQDLTLERPMNSVTGRIHDNISTPLAGVHIEATSTNGTVTAASGTDGLYQLHLADGQWTISASRVGYQSSREPYSLDIPPSHIDINFTLTRVADLRSIYMPFIVR